MGRRPTPEEHRAILKRSILIVHIGDFDPKDIMAVPYMRVSTWEQRKAGHLDRRVQNLRRYLREKGIRRTMFYVEKPTTGKTLENRPELIHAIETAGLRQGMHPNFYVFVVTDTRNRLLRGEQSNGNILLLIRPKEAFAVEVDQVIGATAAPRRRFAPVKLPKLRSSGGSFMDVLSLAAKMQGP